MPKHECYVEPFCGAASVLLNKSRVAAEVINDLDGELVAFFRVLRESPEKLIRAIELTPFARDEFVLSKDRGDHLQPVEKARRLYVRCWQAMHAGLRPKETGWRACKGTNRKTSAADEFADIEHLWPIVNRLRGVQIENDSAVKVIQRYDSSHTLFYVDPPYVRTTRSHKWGKDGYKHEMLEADHEALLETLHSASGMVLLSAYQTPQYDELLVRGWKRTEKEVRTFVNRRAKESLYLNPAAQKGALRLF